MGLKRAFRGARGGALRENAARRSNERGSDKATTAPAPEIVEAPAEKKKSKKRIISESEDDKADGESRQKSTSGVAGAQAIVCEERIQMMQVAQDGGVAGSLGELIAELQELNLGGNATATRHID